MRSLKIPRFNKKNFQKGFIKLSKHTLISYLIVATALFGTGIIYLFNPFGGIKEADAAWFNDNWGYRKNVPITAHTAAETDKYIAVTIADTDDLVTAGQLQSNCADMRFTKQNGDVMPYYIVSGCNSASTVVHVYFDNFPAGAQTIYFYYGNPSTIAGGEAADFTTEASNYTVGTIGSEEKGPSPFSYWRLDDGQGTTAQDSTTNNTDGTITGATWETEDQCISSKCLEFDGTDDVATFGDMTVLEGSSQMTVSFWVKPLGTIGNAEALFMKGNGLSQFSFFLNTAQFDDPTRLNFTVCATNDCSSSGNQYTTNSALSVTHWTHVTLVYDGTQGVETDKIKFYINGKIVADTVESTPVPASLIASTANVSIAATADNLGNFNGVFDELKVYTQAISDTQILTNYNSRSNPEGVAQVLGANTQNMPAALSNGLVGYWKMDESSWSNNCSTESVLDSSGNGNDGASCPNGSGSTGGGAGKFGNAGTFDGSNDYIEIDDSASLDSASTDWTVSTWFYDTDADFTHGTPATFFEKGDSSYQYQPFKARIEWGDFYLQRKDDWSDAGIVYDMDSSGLSTNTWIHFTGTYNSATQTMSLYFNGNLVATQTGISSSISNDGALTIGGTDIQDWYFPGRLDEFRVYNRSLSPAEVSQLYNWAPGPLAYWKMDEASWTNNCSTDTVIDSSGNAINADSCPNSTGPIGGAPGKYGKAGLFDGTDDRLDITSSTLENRLGTAVTISAWVNPRNIAANQYAGIFSDTDGGIYLELADDPGVTNNLTLYSSGFGTVTTPNNTITLNTWQHVAATVSGGTAKLYINGVLQGEGSFTYFGPGDDLFMIGAYDSTGERFNGSIDEVKVYNYPRTQAQIIEDMNAGHPAPGSPVGTPVGYWKLDEGYGDTANNYGNAGSTYNGNLSGSCPGASTCPTWNNNGKFGKALTFVGANSQTVDAGDITALDSTSQFSLSTWAKKTDLGQFIEIGKYTDDNNRLGIELWGDGVAYFHVANGGAAYGYVGMNDTNWHHYVMVYDGSQTGNAQRLKVYIDGQLQVLSFDGTIPATTANHSANFFIGSYAGFYSTGTIDEVKVYAQPLTSDQVKLDMNRAASQVLGAAGSSSTAGNDNASTRTAQSSASQYCVPGSSDTCTGPVGEWKLDEGSSTTANDTSGNGNTGTITAGSGSYVNGKYNKAYRFDGSATFINAGSASGIDDLPSASGLTVEAWFYQSTAGVNKNIINKDNNGVNGWRIITSNSGGGSINATADYATDDININVSSLNISGGWHHVAFSIDQATTTGRLYLNGKLIGTDTGSGSYTTDASRSLCIGAQNCSATNVWSGNIDQVQVYGYTRTPTQIAWDYNKGAPVAHWKMDECQGTTINDMSGRGNTGTLTNASPGTCTTSGSWFDGVTGKRNYSLDFDGTDDFISIPYNSMLTPQTITLSTWVKADSYSNWNKLISYDYRGDTTWTYPFVSFALGFYAGGGNPLFEITTGGGKSEAIAPVINTGQWYHLAAVYNGTDMRLYVNGILGATTSKTGAIDYNSTTNNIAIGRASPYVNENPFDGLIDDTRIYNYPLTEAQVKSLYNDGAARYGPTTGAP